MFCWVSDVDECILKSNYFFISHKIKYIECQKCGHINGKYQDTKNFANQIYFSKKIDYSKEYHAKDIKNFTLRKKLIYDLILIILHFTYQIQ